MDENLDHEGEFKELDEDGSGDINFEEIIVALNDTQYSGPLSVEWEDGRMERFHGATESCAFTKALDFPRNEGGMFDSAFDGDNQ
jgi:sugar phosphate isomerase/epimerase